MALAPQLTMTVSHTVDTIVVTLAGELDLVVEQAVDDYIAYAVTEPGFTALRLDVTLITFIGSSGLRSLIAAERMAIDHGLTFALDMADSGPVERLVTMFGLAGLLSAVA